MPRRSRYLDELERLLWPNGRPKDEAGPKAGPDTLITATTTATTTEVRHG